MADVSINFKDKAAKKFFKRILKQSVLVEKKSRIYVNAVVSKHVIKDVTDHFENQEGGPGKLWPEWSDTYLDHMRKIGKQGNNILTDSARLRNSFGPRKYRISSDSITFFNPARTASGFPYAAAHDEGGRKLPQRRFMWLSNKANKKIGQDTLKFLLKK